MWTIHSRREGPPKGPARAGASPRRVVEQRYDNDDFLSRSRPNVYRLATPLGIDESLAFRAFDKIIIFGHWLSKTQKLALASRAFLLKKAFTIF